MSRSYGPTDETNCEEFETPSLLSYNDDSTPHDDTSDIVNQGQVHDEDGDEEERTNDPDMLTNNNDQTIAKNDGSVPPRLELLSNDPNSICDNNSIITDSLPLILL